MIAQQFLIRTVILVDVAAMLVLGFLDLRKLSAPFMLAPLYIIPPVIVYSLAIVSGAYCFEFLLCIAVIVFLVTVVSVIGVARGELGLLDMVVPVRVPIPFLLSTSPILILYPLVMVVAYIVYVAWRIKPYVCNPSLKTLIRLRVRVKIDEFVAHPHFFPVNVGVEEMDDNALIDYKKQVVEEARKSGEKCVDAIVAVPFVWIFSLAYAVAVASAILS